MSSPRSFLALAMVALSAVLAVLGGVAPAHSHPAPRHARSTAAPALGFSHAVVVDQQRPGFEPDVRVDPKGTVYTSVPFGFSTTQSFVWASRDAGNSYGLTPGNVGPGKPATCAGGGDTDLFTDSSDGLFFSDLQGLTNISNSVSRDGGATWSTNCAGAPNTPDDRMWFAGTGSLAAGNLTLYQNYDAVNSSASGGNQLVETVSHDGTTFTPVINSSPSAVTGGCAGGGALNCVTSNEGLPGNQVVDPTTGNVYIAHTAPNNSSGTPGVQVSEGRMSTAAGVTSATWTESPNLTAPLCPDPTCVDAAGNPELLAGENFASIARDGAGYLYVTFTAGPLDHGSSSDPNFGALTAPEQIYVVHSLAPAGADPATLRWSAPMAISGSGTTAGTNTFPWITAGSDGRVDVAWYHSDSVSQDGTCSGSGSGLCTLYGASNLTRAEWSVVLGQSLNAHDASPAYSASPVSESYVKYGQICTSGLGCATGGDRSLGDFLQVTTDSTGAALVSYVFDTSSDTAAGENVGPEVITRQTSGPSLLASVGSVSQGAGPGRPMGSVSDPTGDASFSANGTRTPASDNLDLTGASLANGPGNTLVATIKVKSLASLAASPSLGGPDASWLVRWTQVTPGVTGNGHIYYAGMDNNSTTSAPTFFDGETVGLPPAASNQHVKYMTYPQTHQLSASQASLDGTTGTITLRIPRADVGNPPDGTVLLSVTAFTATATVPQSASTVFNTIDATTPFELVVGSSGSVGSSPRGPGRTRVPGQPPIQGPGCMRDTGALTSVGIGPFRLGTPRARARRIDRQHSSRGRRNIDYFCLNPSGIRAGYAPASLLRHLPRALRRGLPGRTILLLSDGPRYAIHGARAGTRLSRVSRALHVGRGIRVGANTWYAFRFGAGRGVLEVRHGVIQEVGVVDARLTRTAKATLALLLALRD